MITAFSWMLERHSDAGDWVRILLIDRITISIAPAEQPKWVKSWTYNRVDEARQLALTRTEFWEERGLDLRYPVRVAQVEVDPEALMMECMLDGTRLGPILRGVLSALNEGEVVQ